MSSEQVQITLTPEEQRWLTALLTAQIREDRARASRLYKTGKPIDASRRSARIYSSIAHKIQAAESAAHLRAQDAGEGE